MQIQEVVALTIVAVALFFSARKFLRQFTHADPGGSKCAKCELQKAVNSGGNRK